MSALPPKADKSGMSALCHNRTHAALRVTLAGRCTKYWQMRRSPRRHCSTAGWPVASQKKAARARQTQGSVRTALATGQL